jgi:hypothetical protein
VTQVSFTTQEPRRKIARTADNRLNADVALAVLLIFNDCGCDRVMAIPIT